jgi:uncharacterized repeat protein (TIGR03803 family)
MRASCSAVPTWGKSSYALLLLFVITAMSLPAQTFTTLHNFDLTDGFEPVGALVQTTAGALYGSTEYGGTSSSCTYGCGTIFKITPSGTLTTLYSFCPQSGCTDGSYPYAGLIQATNGDLYGTTINGGANGYGTVFKITPSGTLTTLYSFCSQSGCTDGANPYAGLVQAPKGNFYGTTLGGALIVGCNKYGCGTVFEITPSGTLTTLYSFCSQSGCTDGDAPYAGLLQATNGDFYGTTSEGGANGYGTVFKIAPSGTMTTLHSFDSTDGANPYAGLIQATNGDFYGTTNDGGTQNRGTVFKITPGGTLTTLHSFHFTDGDYPFAGLVQATNGDFYGTTESDKANGDGTVFEITPRGHSDHAVQLRLH